MLQYTTWLALCYSIALLMLNSKLFRSNISATVELICWTCTGTRCWDCYSIHNN